MRFYFQEQEVHDETQTNEFMCLVPDTNFNY